MKKILFALFASLSLSCVFATKVDEKELAQESADKVVKFQSYTKKSAFINSLKGIKNIGEQLGYPVAADRNLNQTVGNKNRYAVIHAIDPTQKNNHDADIILIGSGAAVDHINNLRHIIAAYLCAAYNYSEEDAYTISILVTVYNCLYRGKLDFFTARYKKIVLSYLDAQKCGLSISYKEWPGKTQIVIPLSDGSTASLNSVDISSIASKQVLAAIDVEELNSPALGNVSGEDTPLSQRITILKKKAQSEADKLRGVAPFWKRLVLFLVSAVLLAVGLSFAVYDLMLHKRISKLSENEEMLLSSAQTEDYINDFKLKRAFVFAGFGFNLIAFVLALLALAGAAFAMLPLFFVITVAVLLAVGAVGIAMLASMVVSLSRRLAAVSNAKINPPGTDSDQTIVSDATLPDAPPPVDPIDPTT